MGQKEYHCGKCMGLLELTVSEKNYDLYRCTECGHEETLEKNPDGTYKIPSLLEQIEPDDKREFIP